MTLIISCMVALTHTCSRLDLFHYMVMRNRNMKATIWRPIFQHSSCSYLCMRKGFRVRVMVLNATFNNISVISRRSVLLVKENGVPGENHRPAASHWQTLSHNVVSITHTSPWSKLELASLVLIGAYYTGTKKFICNSNYHTTTPCRRKDSSFVCTISLMHRTCFLVFKII
jgi:hypothetical protein